MGSCSGENLSKTESMIEVMADGEGKNAAQKEIAQAQDAMLSSQDGRLCGPISARRCTSARRSKPESRGRLQSGDRALQAH